MNEMKSPCFQCADRKRIGEMSCHGACERYAKYRAERERVWAEREKWRVETDIIADIRAQRKKL